jgi:hypothetical protein
MRFKPLVLILMAIALGWATAEAQAGVIRFAGKKVGQGTAQVATVTANGAQAAAGGVAEAGKATGSVVKTGAVAAATGVASTPGLAARGAKSAAKGIRKAIW